LRLGVAVEAIHVAALDADEVDGLVKGANNAIVPVETNNNVSIDVGGSL
jgi:hypothetical protein